MANNLPARLKSEEVVLASPRSFTGSARRLWKLARGIHTNRMARAAIYSGVILLIAAVWVLVFVRYVLWYVRLSLSLFVLVPYRLIRRGQHKRDMQELRELLTTIHQIGREPPPAGDGPPPARTRSVTGIHAGNETARDEVAPDRPTGTTGPADT